MGDAFNAARLLSLKRKLEAAEKSGKTEKAELLRAWILDFEAVDEGVAADVVAETIDPQDPQEGPSVEPEPEQADPWAGVDITPAARLKADDLGVTPDDLKDHSPSGKAGFLVSDVTRIARGNSEGDTDGN